jgi:hypothetical protein
MKHLRNGRNALWASYGLLVLFTALLAVRSERTIATVLAGGDPRTPPPTAVAGPAGSSATIVVERNRVIAAATLGERDPFRPPPAPARPGGASPRSTDSDPPPVLRTLLYDRVSPSVQLSIGRATSGWLRAGDAFRGWVVVEISPTSVRITKGDRSLVLTSS